MCEHGESCMHVPVSRFIHVDCEVLHPVHTMCFLKISRLTFVVLLDALPTFPIDLGKTRTVMDTARFFAIE